MLDWNQINLILEVSQYLESTRESWGNAFSEHMAGFPSAPHFNGNKFSDESKAEIIIFCGAEFLVFKPKEFTLDESLFFEQILVEVIWQKINNKLSMDVERSLIVDKLSSYEYKISRLLAVQTYPILECYYSIFIEPLKPYDYEKVSLNSHVIKKMMLFGHMTHIHLTLHKEPHEMFFSSIQKYMKNRT
jgi:hypothetical protein